MDLGMFRRSRVGVWAWIVLPAAVVAIVYGVTTLYIRSVTRGLARRKEFFEKLPGIQKAVAETREAMGGFEMALRDPGEATPELRSLLNRTAVAAGFVINSLSIEELPASNSIDKGGVKASVQGVADMLSVVAFFNELQQPTQLFVIDSLSVGTMEVKQEPLYKVTFVLHWCHGKRG